MAKLDPTKMKDWEIAEAAEATMKTVYQLRDEMGLQEKELFPLMDIMLAKLIT